MDAGARAAVGDEEQDGGADLATLGAAFDGSGSSGGPGRTHGQGNENDDDDAEEEETDEAAVAEGGGRAWRWRDRGRTPSAAALLPHRTAGSDDQGNGDQGNGDKATTATAAAAAAAAHGVRSELDDGADAAARRGVLAKLGVNRRLLPDKLVFLLLWASFACVAPFLSYILSERGLSATQVGLIAGLRPFAGFVGAPVFTAAADRWHAHKMVMLGALVASVLARQGLHISVSFGATAAVILVSDLLGSPVSPLVDHAVLELLGSRASDYGKQRLYGAVGWGAASLVVGAAVQGGNGDVRLYLYAQLLMSAIAAPALLALPSARRDVSDGARAALAKKPSPWPVLRLIATRLDVAAFFLVVFLMGTLMGQITTFLFLFLAELGGQEALFGLSLALTCVSEIPVFFYAGVLIERLGTAGVLTMALLTYAIRFLYYSFLYHPWAVLPAELLHGITYAASWAACTDYAFKMAPPGLGATMQGVLSGVHWGAGQGVGAAVGGLVYEHYGARTSFRGAAALSVVTWIIFAIAERMRQRNLRRHRSPLSPLTDADAVRERGSVTSDIEMTVVDA